MRALLFAVNVALAESLQYNNNRHFLMIHGSGMSGAAFLSSPTERGARNFLNGVPLRADHSTGLVPANWQYAALDARTDDGTWFGDGFKGLDKAVATVESVLASRPEVAGIVGHEQGGTVAAVVAARAALGEGPRPLAFAIICGASMPTAKPYAEVLQRLRSDGQYGTDCADRGPGHPLPPPAAGPSSLRAGTGICTTTCFFDGGLSSEFSMCAYGTDCGARTASPPPPPHSSGIVHTNNCLNAGGNGGPSSKFATLAFGTDCIDCGPRVSMPSPPPRPPAGHPAPSLPPSITARTRASTSPTLLAITAASATWSAPTAPTVQAVASTPSAVTSMDRAVTSAPPVAL